MTIARSRPGGAFIWSHAMAPEEFINGQAALHSSDLFVELVAAQQFPGPAVGADDAKRNVSRGKVSMQPVQHRRT